MSIRFQADNDLKRVIVDATLVANLGSISKLPTQPVWTVSTTKLFCD